MGRDFRKLNFVDGVGSLPSEGLAFLSFLFADIVKPLFMVERPEFDKHILSHPDLKFHH